MTRVSLITIFDNCNFGTYLQCLALSKVFERFNAEIEIVDYRRKFNQYHRLLNPLRKGFCYNIKSFIKNLGIMYVRFREHRYVRRFCKVTHTYYDFDDIKAAPPKADIYITGSDQVWNIAHNRGIDKTFYLDYAPQGIRRCAYGASIGMEEIPNHYKPEIKSLLEKYDYISVRETSNKNLLFQLGIKDVDVVLDPTLLLNKNDWEKYVVDSLAPNYDYLLVYSVEKAEQRKLVGEVARKIADKNGLKVVCISYGGKGSRIPGCDKYFYYSSIERFITLFYHAKFTVVSSFHGTAFSINMNKPFITVTPDQFSSRIDSLLNLTHLGERKVSKVEDIVDISLGEIDFDNVNIILSEWREKSLNIIKSKILKM